MIIRDGSDFPPVPVSRTDADWDDFAIFCFSVYHETTAQTNELWETYQRGVSAPIVLDFISWIYDLRAPLMRVLKQTV